jgi:hypothetical protein
MIEDTCWDQLKCCMRDVHEHFLQDAKLLSCRHFVCNKCIIPQLQIKCGRCLTMNTLDMTKAPVAKVCEVSIRENLNVLSSVLFYDLRNLENDIRRK